MKQWSRVLIYLTLNVLVSACTTFAVLFAWDQLRGPLPRGLLPEALSKLIPATPTAASLPEETGVVVITATPTEAFIVHIVQPGETFESIAEQYGVSVEELIAVNGFKKSQPLGAGEVLRIPKHPKGNVVISSVIAAGDLESERILFQHRGEGDISLVGWRIEDSAGNAFTFPPFPQITLYKNGSIYIYTKDGVNSVVELYLGQDKAMWKSGDTVVLRDAQGNVHTTYIVP